MENICSVFRLHKRKKPLLPGSGQFARDRQGGLDKKGALPHLHHFALFPKCMICSKSFLGRGEHFVLSLYCCKVAQSAHTLTGVFLVPGVNWLPRVLYDSVMTTTISPRKKMSRGLTGCTEEVKRLINVRRWTHFPDFGRQTRKR